MYDFVNKSAYELRDRRVLFLSFPLSKELEHCEDLKHVRGNDYNEMRHAQPRVRLRLESKVDGRRHQSTVIHTVAAVW
jgi:hypothetical protein